MSEKRFDPTPASLRRLRERGMVPQAKDLSRACALAAGLGVVMARSQGCIQDFARLLREAVQRSEVAGLAPASQGSPIDVHLGFLLAGVGLGAKEALYAGCAAMLAAIAVSFVFSGPVFSTQAVAIDAERLSPGRNLQQLAPRKIAWNGLRFLVAFGASLAVAATVLGNEVPTILSLWRTDTGGILVVFGRTMLATVACVLACGIGFGAVDAIESRMSFLRDNRMSFDELRREHKEDEPGMGRAERQRARERLMSDHFSAQCVAAEDADAAVRNPTHLVVLIRCDSPTSPPRVVARGAGAQAEILLDIVRRRNIPDFHDVPLARRLFRVEVGERIPLDPALSQALVKLLLDAERRMRLSGRVPNWRKPRAGASARVSDADGGDGWRGSAAGAVAASPGQGARGPRRFRRGRT